MKDIEKTNENQEKTNLDELTNTQEGKRMLEGIKKTQEPIKKVQKEMQKINSIIPDIGEQLEKSSKELTESFEEMQENEAEDRVQPYIQTEQNKELIKLAKDDFKLSKKYFYLAIITLIVTVGLMIGLSWFENHQEKTRQVNELISNLDSLYLELNAIEQYIKLLEEGELEKGMIYNELVLENLQNAVANGNIRNKDIKINLIFMYFQLLEIKNSIKTLNSPEYIQLFDLPETYFVKSQMFSEGIKKSIIEREISKNINISKYDLLKYRECIEEERNFDKC